MIGRLVNAALGRLGYRLVRTRRGRTDSERFSRLQEVRAAVDRIASAPLDPAAHARLSALALGHRLPYLAHAQERNMRWLAKQGLRTRTPPGTSVPATIDLGHNAYHRLKALAELLEAEGCGRGSSVLDVGGGHGELAAFVPEADYFLADPVANGISAESLPAALGGFDFAVSCHVLEHVPTSQRRSFLDRLLTHAGTVVLLNPFHMDGSSERERLQLVIDVTGARWAAEHLDCSLPRLEDVRSYASDRGLSFAVRPVGALVAALAWVFVERFSHAADDHRDFAVINRFFNERLCAAEASEQFPAAYAVVLRRKRESG